MEDSTQLHNSVFLFKTLVSNSGLHSRCLSVYQTIRAYCSRLRVVRLLCVYGMIASACLHIIVTHSHINSTRVSFLPFLLARPLRNSFLTSSPLARACARSRVCVPIRWSPNTKIRSTPFVLRDQLCIIVIIFTISPSSSCAYAFCVRP